LTENGFSVTIDGAQLVDELKKAIEKKENPPAFVAVALTLYKVDVDESDDDKCIEKAAGHIPEIGQPEGGREAPLVVQVIEVFRGIESH
jgi:Crinkler effector protein N-terminal domain